MKIQVFSIHPLFDNRIGRHFNTLLKNKYEIEYVNASVSNVEEFEQNSNIKLHHIKEPFIKSNIKGILKAWRKMCYLVKNSEADIVHVHDAVLIPLLYFAKKKNRITVYDKHESYEKINCFNARVGTMFERIFKKYIDGVIYVNNQQEEYLDYLGFKIKKMIPNYQSVEAFNTQQSEIKTDKEVQMVYIGSLSQVDRNISLMMNVIDKVMDKCPEAKCIIGGTTDDEEIRNKIADLSNKYKNFEYKGLVKYSDVASITVNSDIGLYFARECPNNHLSSPNKIYEYMIAGVAIVGMGDFTHADKINENAGRVFGFDVVCEEIAECMIDMINNFDKLQEYKLNSKNMGNKYTWESVEGRYIEVYNMIKNKMNV